MCCQVADSDAEAARPSLTRRLRVRASASMIGNGASREVLRPAVRAAAPHWHAAGAAWHAALAHWPGQWPRRPSSTPPPPAGPAAAAAVLSRAVAAAFAPSSRPEQPSESESSAAGGGPRPGSTKTTRASARPTARDDRPDSDRPDSGSDRRTRPGSPPGRVDHGAHWHRDAAPI